MSKFCTNCGATLEDDAVFCPECGARFGVAPDAAGETPAEEFRPEAQETAAPEPMPAKPQPDPEPERPRPESVRPEQVRQTAPPAPAPLPAASAAPEPRSKEISTAGYFWLILLFAIPVVGFIAILIFAFAVKNRNLRNFGRAHLVWIVVALIALVLLWIALQVILKVTGAEIDWQGIFDNFRNIFPFLS